MLNSGKKFRASHDKKINILTWQKLSYMNMAKTKLHEYGKN
jgi:hypothetical protein